MFEAHVLHLLKRYLGEYVHGLSAEALRISVWKGDVVLKDLRLKAEALNALKLPVTVRAGFVGTITLKVPWKSLGKEPVIVLIDRVFILAHPASDGRTLKEEDKQKLFDAKLQQIEEAELATLEATSRSKSGTPPASSWLGSLIATIIGNLKISISNVHVRYEDSTSNAGHPFSCGVTLAKLAAVTVDEQGNETFDTSGALDRLRKSVELERLAVYHDPNNLPWKIDKGWEDLTPSEWVEIFEDGIGEPSSNGGLGSKWAATRNYLISPINGVLKYHRLGKQERNDPDTPFEKASLVLSDVLLTMSEVQYHDWIKLLEVFSRYKVYIEVSHLRPGVPVSEDPKLWWRYFAQAVLQQRKMCYRLSWDQIQHLCQLRRRYVQLYAGLLQQSSSDNSSKLRDMEKDLDSKVILLWRLLAHAKAESVKTKEAAERKKLKKKSWFSLRWQADSEDASVGGSSEASQSTEEGFTKQEWQAINNLLSSHGEEELLSHLGKDTQNMIQFLVTISVEKAAARVVDIYDTEIIRGTFEQLHVSTKFKGRSTQCDLLLKYYGLSAPEGSLAESVSSEQKVNALSACFVYSPIGENLDWKLAATISPCHATVLMESFDRVFDFMKRSSAVSPTVALETANVLQTKIEKVTRRAQEQFQMALEEQRKFALDIDLDAPKVRVPMKVGSSECDTDFLLDFGHFTLHTMEAQSDEQRQSIYSRFHITGRDIAAFFVNRTPDTPTIPSVKSTCMETVGSFYSLIDRCGMSVIIDQIKVPHPSYPSTRISIQVPNLGIHLSPTRYCRIMELINILYSTMGNYGDSSEDNINAPTTHWSSADMSVDARILVWKGIGHSVAAWQPCFIVLSGLYLYAMESQKSSSYNRYLSMSGRQVVEVPPSSVGGSQHCLAVSFRGLDIQQALESSSTWVLEFRDEEEKGTWLRGLIQATYKASAPASIDVLGESATTVNEFGDPQHAAIRKADLIVSGTLVETKLCIYGKSGDDSGKQEERLLLEVLAQGGKVHLMRSDAELVVKMKLHSFKVKDELQGSQSTIPCYLACSVLRDNKSAVSSCTLDLQGKHTNPLPPDDDEDFTDALQDFQPLSDSGMFSPKFDMPHSMTTLDASDSLFESDQSIAGCQDAIQGKNNCGEIFYEVHGGEIQDFVSVNFSTRSSSSPDYDGTDTHMSVRMSKLEFFCNRPTIVALIGFGFDLGHTSSVERTCEESDHVPSINKERMEGTGRVKGVLGFGKSRVVFCLDMKVDSVTMFLNKEDGSQLAMLVQENFLLDLKVHPSSLSIEGTLGNFKLCDMSLGDDHCWSWLCDIRNPGIESLIKFKFSSYSAEDDDYEGYDYCLSGRLSAVRIVFLYRFIQEITAYFMGLASPQTEEAIKLVDKVGGFEWLIQKYEIDGATALKLDLSLDTPIIIVPKNSRSKDFIQLDLGQLHVMNELRWFGDPEDDPSAVHMDILHAEILGINMSVGVDGCLGKLMVREGQGFDVYVRRSLRDVFRKVPSFSLEIKVGFLRGVMSDREYKVILDCTYANLHEQPILPPSFRGSKSGGNDTMRLLVDKVNSNSQVLLSQTATVVEVEVQNALLELCNGAHESPLAHLALEGLWVSYRMTSLSETDLYVTIPKFSILDIRPDTRSEMRLMLGSSADASKQASSGNHPNFLNRSSMKISSESIPDMDLPNPTMFLMDYRWRMTSQSCVIRIQQPRVLVVPDFLLAVGEFFVPAIGTITGREESMDPKRDPINVRNSIVLSCPVYKQTDDVVRLSPSRQLVVDANGIDEYIYDGCGKIISLSEETNLKLQFHPIIFIGRGKKLRFTNVKIENGSLLRKCVYLSNDSSYSISVEDGVDVSMSESTLSDNNEKPREHMHFSGTADSSGGQSESNIIQSFTFESQVVSPEFTFYDSSKSSLDDSSYGEKLLRAKMDLSFMYAAKENDTWIRALVKDMTVEAGSGLVILDPVDISGGYTSVKEKTNMSLISTDICIHLSLGAISLLLHLQNQVVAALQFGNAVPLVTCTNFNRVWVSPKENGPHNNLTFWRPQAPSNYVILGDCVTSRSIPPTQAVMAVSNTYGRVRKPIGYNLIALFSGIQGPEVEGNLDIDSDCSLWMPIAPPGYSALGCVAHIGNQPPPNHVVYCLRSDLVASAGFSECIFSALPNNLYPSGFSIWRLDNVIASFYAHSSSEYPPKDISFDLSHHFLWNSTHHHLSSKETVLGSTAELDQSSQQSNETSSSGWDIIRSISRASNHCISTPNFERIWWDKGSDVRRPVSIWRPVTRPGYAILGDCITEGLDPPALGIILKADNHGISANPVQFTKVAQIVGRASDEVFFWYPIAAPGYASLGCIVTRVDQAPRIDLCCCPRLDLVSQANIVEVPISRSSSSRASQCWSIWKVENQACTFLARSDLKKPSSRLAFAVGESLKPKSRENVTCDVKLKCFSITVLDSLCGTMTPLFDTTITNIKLATHGRLDAMNAVLVSSVAASAFNTQLEAWEPLVEPFDGIFKFETYNTDVHQPSRLAKRIRLAATSIVNINISAANLDTYVGTILSWRKQLELDQKATKLKEEAGSHDEHHEESSYSALDEDDSQTVIIENQLGCDMHLKKVGDNLDAVDHLRHGELASVWIPPPRFSDRLKVADEFRDARCYVVVRILEAKGLPITDDGSSHNFFCALRLLVDSQAADQQKLFPQSARTKCVKTFLSDDEEFNYVTAKWNEIFILEIPRKAPAKLEVEVTNLAAKAGKGEVVGSLSLPIGHGAVTLKKVASVRMLHQPHDVQNIVSCPLRKRAQHGMVEDTSENGSLFLSTTYFERKVAADIHRDRETKDSSESDIGFWIRLGDEDAWESIRSLLPLSVIPKVIENDFIAMEVMMKDGKKHAIFRGLATVENELDVKLEVCVCHMSSLYGNDPSARGGSLNIAIEEIFENQHYHPISGWGNKWSGFRSNDRWSTRDFASSSKEFFEPSLPSGWQWTSPWIIDKSESVDDDGWAYGPDFHILKWPPSSQSRTRSAQDLVRRRRWIRRKQQAAGDGFNNINGDLFSVVPGSSVVLPWRSVSRDSEQCLLVRPLVEHPQTSYTWGQAITVGKDQPFTDQSMLARQSTLKYGSKTPYALKLSQLEKKDVLLCCNPGRGSQNLWLSVGADASVLHTDLNIPVYDWTISVNSPLKLENQLPCPAEFTIWENAKEGSCIERQTGIIFPRKCALICSADINKAIYLTLHVQGGWVLEKDPVLVLDLASAENVSSFWMVHQQSKRRLRVSIERDIGETVAAPKTIRLFVPYWIVNESSLPLTYRVVEIDPSDHGDSDSALLSRVKSAKAALRVPTMERKRHSMKRNIQVLEVIEDTSPLPGMFSLYESAARGVLSFPAQKESYINPRLGLAVTMRHSDVYSPGISLLDLEKKERVDVKAYSADGSYYMLSALLKTSDRTKVVHFQPHALFVNRVGVSLCLQQCDSQTVEWIHPTDPPKLFGWQSTTKFELLKLKVEGYEWSTPFSVSNEGRMRISLKQAGGHSQMQLRVQVRTGAKSSRYEVIFCPNSSSSSYRIENRSMFLPIHFRQVDGPDDAWKLLLPNSAGSFFWEDLGRQRLMELLVDGTDRSQSLKYDVDEIFDHQPVQVGNRLARALRVTVSKEDKTNIVKIFDWMPENDPATSLDGRGPSLSRELTKNDHQQQLPQNGDNEFHFIVELAELGVSVVDHTPEEILYFSIQNLLLAYSSGLGSGLSRFKLRMLGIQVDNQLPLAPMPVLFRPQKVGEETDYILKLSVTLQSNGSIDLHVYPYIGFSGLDGSAFLINIHEPIIWRLHEMINQINLSRLSDRETTAVSVDPIIKIGVLNISEVRFKLSMAMSPGQRPRGVLGFWSSLMTALGNTENMPVRINQKFQENICMRKSTMISIAISNVKKDLLGQPLQLLSGVDILGNASSALGHMSKGVAALSMDKKFIESRQRQENKGVEDFGDVIREGGGALAKGFFRGVTGILTKPLEGAKSSGVEGFVQGVGKGIIGAAAQPVSGVLDLLSKTTEGANAMRMKIQSAITSEEQLLRRRLPRVISGDNLLRPYDEYKAQGQVILQLAESGSFFGQVDLFKVRGKFALTDAYEDHYMLPKGKIVVVTHRRVMLLQQPSNIIGQRKFSPARDPCSVMWDVSWDNLVTMELTHGKKDQSNAPPSKLVLYLRSKPAEGKESNRVIKCSRDTDQAFRVYISVDRAMNTYSTHHSKEVQKNKVTKPYSPSEESNLEVNTKGGLIWSGQQVPGTIPSSSTFGSTSN